MKTEFSFKHIDSSDALMNYADERMEKLTRFELKPMDVLFTVSLENRHECRVEVNVIEGRRKFKAEATSDDFYRSVDMCINKLSRQLSKDKSRVKHHKNADRSAQGKLARLNEQLEIDFSLEKPLRKAG